jgi:hypothetical protein
MVKNVKVKNKHVVVDGCGQSTCAGTLNKVPYIN